MVSTPKDFDAGGPGANRTGLGIFEYTTRSGLVYGHAGNTVGCTQLGVGAPDDRRNVTLCALPAD